MRRLSLVTFAGLLATAVSAADFGAGFQQQMVPVEGCTVSATVGGQGPAVVLLHGYAETAQMWKPLAVKLAPRFTVIALDLPAIGDSSIPKSGIDMKSSAERIHAARPAAGERAGSRRRPRHGPHGPLRVRRHVPTGGGAAAADAPLPPRHRGGGGDLHPPRHLALPLLWQNARAAGQGPRADVLR